MLLLSQSFSIVILVLTVGYSILNRCSCRSKRLLVAKCSNAYPHQRKITVRSFNGIATACQNSCLPSSQYFAFQKWYFWEMCLRLLHLVRRRRRLLHLWLNKLPYRILHYYLWSNQLNFPWEQNCPQRLQTNSLVVTIILNLGSTKSVKTEFCFLRSEGSEWRPGFTKRIK